jgi:hypothetical protein
VKRAKSGRRPLFLDPDRYRRRRLMDAARMLPVLGAFLLLLPTLWRPGTSGHSTAIDGIYLFAVWAALILVARLFAPGLASGEARAGDPVPGDPALTDLPQDPAPDPLAEPSRGGGDTG